MIFFFEPETKHPKNKHEISQSPSLGNWCVNIGVNTHSEDFLYLRFNLLIISI